MRHSAILIYAVLLCAWPAFADNVKHPCTNRVAIRRCALSAGQADVELYVTGLNHALNEAEHVAQIGVDELVSVIVGAVRKDGTDPDEIIVALSAGATASCDAGSMQWPNRPPYNSQCVANALRKRLKREFQISEWYPDDQHWDGRAIISGPRWVPIAPRGHLDLPSGHPDFPGCRTDTVNGYYATFEDARNPMRWFTIYTTHTPGGDCGRPADRAMLDDARKRPPPPGKSYAGQIATLFVGDFNSTTADANLANDLSSNFVWFDNKLRCPAQGGVAEVSMNLEGNVIHALGARGFACPPWQFVPISVSYSADERGRPSCPDNGIEVRDISHNIVALGLAIAPAAGCDGHSSCKDQQCVPDPTCSAGKTVCSGVCYDLQTDKNHCGSCTASPCGPQQGCKNGQCFTLIPSCSACKQECQNEVQSCIAGCDSGQCRANCSHAAQACTRSCNC